VTLIAANTAGVLQAASNLHPTGAAASVGRAGHLPLGEPGAESAMDSFSRSLSARVAELDDLVDRGAAVLAAYVVNFDRAGA
jgi:hypothetical protein